MNRSRFPVVPSVEVIRRIREFVTPLSPPVFAFEREIRDTPFRILISVLLSSRTQDRVTMAASRRLFGRASTPRAMEALTVDEIASLIRPVGFFRQKAANIAEIARRVGRRGGVPDRYEELIELPGIGPKSANLVLALAFHVPAIAVDTHVGRISLRLGWTKEETPAGVERDLKRLFPKEHWHEINQTLVAFGQVVCRPVAPRCGECLLRGECPSSSVR